MLNRTLTSNFARLIFLLILGVSCHGTNTTEPVAISNVGPGSILFLAYHHQAKHPSQSVSKKRLYSMNVDGTNIRPLTDTSITVTFASYSPDGKRIVLAMGHPSYRYEVVESLKVMDCDGGHPRLLTNTPARFAVWSPDSRQIAFNVEQSFPGGYSIFGFNAIGADGTGERRLTKDYGVYHLSGWPKGSCLLGYVTKDTLDGTKTVDGNYIFLMDTLGKIQQRWGGGGESSWAPLASEDGRYIVYISTKSGTRSAYLLDVDRNRDSLILQDQREVFKEPRAFSPDGLQLLYNAGYSDYNKMRILDLRTGAVKDIAPFKDDTTTCLAVSWGRN